MTRDWLDDPTTSFEDKMTRFESLRPVETRCPRPTGHPLLIEAMEYEPGSLTHTSSDRP